MITTSNENRTFTDEKELKAEIKKFLDCGNWKYKDMTLNNIFMNLCCKFSLDLTKKGPIEFLKYCEEESFNVNNNSYTLLFLKKLKEEIGWIKD